MARQAQFIYVYLNRFLWPFGLHVYLQCCRSEPRSTPLCAKFNDFDPFSLTLSFSIGSLSHTPSSFFLSRSPLNSIFDGRMRWFFSLAGICDLFKVIVTVDIDANEHCNLPSIDWMIFLSLFLANLWSAYYVCLLNNFRSAEFYLWTHGRLMVMLMSL